MKLLKILMKRFCELDQFKGAQRFRCMKIDGLVLPDIEEDFLNQVKVPDPHQQQVVLFDLRMTEDGGEDHCVGPFHVAEEFSEEGKCIHDDSGKNGRPSKGIGVERNTHQRLPFNPFSDFRHGEYFDHVDQNADAVEGEINPSPKVGDLVEGDTRERTAAHVIREGGIARRTLNRDFSWRGVHGHKSLIPFDGKTVGISLKNHGVFGRIRGQDETAILQL